jgi:hypothetical protein
MCNTEVLSVYKVNNVYFPDRSGSLLSKRTRVMLVYREFEEFPIINLQ